jgi:hypothetical protein
MSVIQDVSVWLAGKRFIIPCAYALLAILIAYPISGRTHDYHPLTVGNQRYYESDLGETQLMTIIGEATILGAATRVRRQDMVADLFENFWTSDSAGNLYLHGARNLLDHVEWGFLPPVRIVDAPLELGKAWVTEGVQIYDLDGTPWGDPPIDHRLRVYFEGNVGVPAGEFYSFGVGWDVGVVLLESPTGEVYDVFGRHVSAGEELTQADITDWYSDGIGLVQHTVWAAGQHPLELQWWSSPVSTRSSSWGRIKQLFR